MKARASQLRVFLSIGIMSSVALVILISSIYLVKRSLARKVSTFVRGIAVHDQYDRQSFFPKEWLSEPSDCNGTQIEPAEAQRVIPIIEQFASSYNARILEHNLTDIYLLGELTCFGKPYGGTNTFTALHVKVGSLEDGYTEQFLLSLLHAEFSSILMRNYPFPAEAWKAVNEEDFVYSDDAVQILDQNELQESRPELLKAGFLDRYATTTMENDFNEFASWLFVWPDELCDMQNNYEKIAQKYDLAIEFYTSIDPDMEQLSCK